MRRALHSTAGGSDKFWRISTFGADLAVHWGRTGTIGRVSVKEHDDDAACLAAATALADAKVRRGYVELDETAAAAAFDDHVYLDDEEHGPHPLTSHPRFAEHFVGDLWFSPIDEEGPFGNDSGSDTLATLTDRVRAKGRAFDPVGLADLPRAIVEDDWDMRYVVPAELTATEADLAVTRAPGQQLSDATLMYHSDQVTVAVAFGSLKIFGAVAPVPWLRCCARARSRRWSGSR